MRLQGIMVVVFIILDWIFVLMNKTTMMPCWYVSKRELAINVTVIIIIILHSSSVHFSYVSMYTC